MDKWNSITNVTFMFILLFEIIFTVPISNILICIYVMYACMTVSYILFNKYKCTLSYFLQLHIRNHHQRSL